MNHIHIQVYTQMMMTNKDTLKIDYPYIHHQIEKHFRARYKSLRLCMIGSTSISTSSTAIYTITDGL